MNLPVILLTFACAVDNGSTFRTTLKWVLGFSSRLTTMTTYSCVGHDGSVVGWQRVILCWNARYIPIQGGGLFYKEDRACTG